MGSAGCQHSESRSTAEPTGELGLLIDFRRPILPFLESYSTAKFSALVKGTLLVFPCLRTNKRVLVYDQVYILTLA